MAAAIATPAASGGGSGSSSAATPIAGGAGASKSFARRDHLRELESIAQARWEAEREFEVDAPGESEGASVPPKFMVTFPYPYMNGRLHLGHAFSATKAEFAAGFQRLLGKRVLFPFAFHCTGMPIQAAATKLKRELESGAIHSSAAETVAAAAEAAEVAVEAAAAAVVEAVAGGAGGHTHAGAVPAHEGKTHDPTKFVSKKTKAAAKSAGNTQYEIMEKNGIPAAEIPAFADPRYWLRYFPPYGRTDLKAFGAHVDWRRSFITTDANPYYDSFIRWQFNTLKAGGYLGFGKRPTIFSPMDGQACADHDRASGEGVVPQEYTLIKLRLMEVPAGHHAAAALAPVAALMADGVAVFLAAATLRPETMYGQTNCFLLPEGEYGVFRVSDGEAFVCTERSARNMAFQGLSRAPGVVEQVAAVTGADLMGLPLDAPNAAIRPVYTLPLLTISMTKGTGVVTSVPSDAPDDWAALRDLKDKPKLREKYHITDAMVAPDVVEIIEIPELGRRAAVKLVDELKIKSQNDKVLLAAAKDRVYQAGFYTGVMLVGRCAGMKVFEAKPLVRADMLAAGQAAVYHEPDGEVISRSGDECVVAPVDQWYLTYGEEAWRTAVQTWIRSPGFTTYSAGTAAQLDATVAWLKEWACSRSFGLGTRVPWDEQFVIESLSDSTIYMAFYTIAHLLQGGELDPAKVGAPGPLGITPDQLNDGVWNHVFLGAPAPADTTIPAASLARLRREFEYWYPMDLRVSGKDLINNHLTMALYNHAAIWGARPDRMPQSFFCNGHVLVNGEKMSKSRGNFITLKDALENWGADATRFVLAGLGDTLEEADFVTDMAEKAILRLTTEEDTAKEMVAAIADGKLRTGEKTFGDLAFESRINKCIKEAEAAYRAMRFCDAIKFAFYQLQLDRDSYRDYCAKMGVVLHADTITRFMEVQFVMLAPICPHMCEHVWTNILKKSGSVTRAAWPTAGAIDDALLAADEYLQGRLHIFRQQLQRVLQVKVGKGKPLPDILEANIFIAKAYTPWQRVVLAALAAHHDVATHGVAAGGFPADVVDKVKAVLLADATMKPLFKKAMEFVAVVVAAHRGQAAALPSLRCEPPLDEEALWRANMEYVRKALAIPVVNILCIEDDGVIALDTSGRAKEVTVGEPCASVAKHA